MLTLLAGWVMATYVTWDGVQTWRGHESAAALYMRRKGADPNATYSRLNPRTWFGAYCAAALLMGPGFGLICLAALLNVAVNLSQHSFVYGMIIGVGVVAMAVGFVYFLLYQHAVPDRWKPPAHRKSGRRPRAGGSTRA